MQVCLQSYFLNTCQSDLVNKTHGDIWCQNNVYSFLGEIEVYMYASLQMDACLPTLPPLCLIHSERATGSTCDPRIHSLLGIAEDTCVTGSLSSLSNNSCFYPAALLNKDSNGSSLHPQRNSPNISVVTQGILIAIL